MADQFTIQSVKNGGKKRGRCSEFDLDLPEFGYARNKQSRIEYNLEYGSRVFDNDETKIVVNVLMMYETELNFMKTFRHLFQEIYTKEEMNEYDEIISSIEIEIGLREFDYTLTDLNFDDKKKKIFCDFLLKGLWEKQEKDDTKISHDDMVLCEYSPNSQRYIEQYDQEKFVGKVFYADYANHNYLMYRIDDDGTLIIRSLEVEGCHFMGLARGYFADISKLS